MVLMSTTDLSRTRTNLSFFKPKKPVLGGVLSGTVEATGKNVKHFKVGDCVFGSSFPNLSAYAEYICLSENGKLAIKPENFSHEEAAALVFGGMTALHFFRKANVQPGQKVLIYGASGAVGSAAVQIAKYFGAEVTGVCSTANVEMVKKLGADYVIDYTKTDIQSLDLHKLRNRNSTHCALDQFRTEGYRAFFKGLGITMLSSFPVNGVAFLSVEWVMRFMGWKSV